jgi:hypothetical protein
MTMSVRQFIEHNFWLKVFALILALLTWITVRFAISRQLAFGSAPISAVTRVFPNSPVRLLTVANMAGRYHLVPNEVTVTLGGDATILEKLSGKEVTPFVNISKGFAGTGGVGKVEIFAPAGMSILKIEPSEVTVERMEADTVAPKY